MASIVAIHGIGQQLKGPHTLHNEWWPWIRDGVSASGKTLSDGDLVCAFYGDLFRAPGELREAADYSYRETDVNEEFESELLYDWWQAAASAEPDRVVSPDAEVRRGVPHSVQAGLRALSRSKFFVGLATHALIGDLKQVRLYMSEQSVRDESQQRVNAVVKSDTRVIVGHSLGSVIAYEALHRYELASNWANVRTLVTLGSPLGISNLIFSRLIPAPNNNVGKWPALLHSWTNLSADNDVVALEKRLGPLFDRRIIDMRVHNEAKAHDVSPYLTADATGAAIANGLS